MASGVALSCPGRASAQRESDPGSRCYRTCTPRFARPGRVAARPGCEHDHHLRRHHPRRRPQRAHPAGLSRQGRAQDAGDRAPAGRRRRTCARWKTRAIPASCTTRTPSSSAPSPRCRGTPISSSNGTAPATSSPSSTSRCSPATAARWNGGPTSHETIASFAPSAAATPTRCAAGTTSSCRSCSDILAPEGRSPPLPPQERRALLARSSAGRRLLEVSALSPLQFVEQEFEHPDDQGRAPVLQRTARGRPAAAGLRPSHRRAAGEPGQGADVARRLGGAGARARSGGARDAAARSG